ncbi:Serine/threonine protein kinase PRP4 [Mycena kentingensis (nom. inval.)]|nr:Serine/threonine protein kinase PRP4 [Mycena kentingensis (nom. inval.)]
MLRLQTRLPIPGRTLCVARTSTTRELATDASTDPTSSAARQSRKLTPLYTLNANKLYPSQYRDISSLPRLFKCTVTYAPLNNATGVLPPFPPDTRGGEDLHAPSGESKGEYSLLKILASHPEWTEVLLKDGLIPPELVELGQKVAATPFAMTLGLEQYLLVVLRGEAHKLSLKGPFTDYRVRRAPSRGFAPYAGKALVHFELSDDPKHRDAPHRRAVLRVLKLLRPVSLAVPVYDWHILPPMEGELVRRHQPNEDISERTTRLCNAYIEGFQAGRTPEGFEVKGKIKPWLLHIDTPKWAPLAKLLDEETRQPIFLKERIWASTAVVGLANGRRAGGAGIGSARGGRDGRDRGRETEADTSRDHSLPVAASAPPRPTSARTSPPTSTANPSTEPTPMHLEERELDLNPHPGASCERDAPTRGSANGAPPLPSAARRLQTAISVLFYAVKQDDQSTPTNQPLHRLPATLKQRRDYDPSRDRHEDEAGAVVSVPFPTPVGPVPDDDVDDMFAFASSSAPKEKKQGEARRCATIPQQILPPSDFEGYTVILGSAGDEGGRELAIEIVRSQEVMQRAGWTEAAIVNILQAADAADEKHVAHLKQTFKHHGHLCLVFENPSMNLRTVVKRFGKDVGLRRAVRAYASASSASLMRISSWTISSPQVNEPKTVLTLCDSDLGSASDGAESDLVDECKTVLNLCDSDLGSASGKAESILVNGIKTITPYLGSGVYRAPEIILGAPHDASLDIWSVGCTLYELYMGKKSSQHGATAICYRGGGLTAR